MTQCLIYGVVQKVSLYLEVGIISRKSCDVGLFRKSLNFQATPQT